MMTTAPAREAKLNTPTVFNGDRTKTDDFLLETELYLQGNKDVYTTDKKKIIFTWLYMKGGVAGDWKALRVEEYTTPVTGSFPTWETFKKSNQGLLLDSRHRCGC